MTTYQEPLHRRAGASLTLVAIIGTLGIGGLVACAGDRDAGGRASADTADAAVQPLARLDSAPNPAGPGSGEPNLFAGPGGAYLSWLEPAADGRHALRFARWDGAAWGEPATVIERDGLFVNWADFPALVALPDGTLAAHWLQKSGPSTYSYDVRMALSRDGGVTWGGDVIPHRDGVQAEHGFVSLFPLGDSVGVVWLDGRATPDGDPMTLRFTTLAPDGGAGEEVLLDASTCDCCQTGVALATDGPVVAYRDRTADEVRDIHVVRRVDGRWIEGGPVHEDGWTIDACPVNGPAIVAEGERVAVAWYTGADGEPGAVRVAFSSDGGATFGQPVRGDDGRPIGRVALANLDDGAVLLAWLEQSDRGGEIRVRRIDGTGAGPSRLVATTQTARASGFPRMARHGDRLLFAWTRPGDPATIGTATAPVPPAVATTAAADAGER